ncbi:MAG: cyclase family protein [Candidatus Wallacebacter cryptica]|jgi:kynurenine formamidase|nr:cyclase family protein [Bacillota bacterium]
MIIDLTHEITDQMPVYPGDSATRLTHARVFTSDSYNNYDLSINMHTGTHIDGPMHLTASQTYLNEIDLSTFIGEGCVIDVSAEPNVIRGKSEYEEIINGKQIVFFHTGHSKTFGQPAYFCEYPVLSLDIAELIVKNKVKMIGLDTPSPDKDPFDVHKYLFEHGVLIIENLTRLDQLLDYKSFEVIALPLNIKADSSIARVVARVKG